MVAVVLPDATGVASARPGEVKYWSGIEALVKETISPPIAAKVYPVRKKKRADRGMGLGSVDGGAGEKEE